MKEFMFNDETVKVIEATGYHDGYYWDMSASIEFRGEFYSLYDAGSGSGYIGCCSGITKHPFKRLYGEEQEIIKEDEWGYFESVIRDLLNEFINSGAKTSWEITEDDCWNDHVLVDGVEQEVEEES